MLKIGKRFYYLISIGHGILLFICLWLLNNGAYTTDADEGILSKVNKLEKSLFNSKPHYDHKFVFINVSKDLKLQSDPNEYGDISITDRTKLALFFKLLADNGNHHYFALCDVFLEYPSDDDSALLAATNRCNNLLFPYHLTHDTVQQPFLAVPAALSDFMTYTGRFAKFKLLYKDSLKTTPLVLLETLDNSAYPSSLLNFKSIFPEYYIMPDQLYKSKEYPYFNLGELLILSQATPGFYNQFLKNNFIVIGNFDTDVHSSIVGDMPGPLILLNSYLTLRNGAHANWLWALFMIFLMSVISYHLFFGKVAAPDLKKGPWVALLMEIFVNNYISFSGICLLMVILSSLVFSVQLNMALLLTYLCAVNFFINFYQKHFKKPQ